MLELIVFIYISINKKKIHKRDPNYIYCSPCLNLIWFILWQTQVIIKKANQRKENNLQHLSHSSEEKTCRPNQPNITLLLSMIRNNFETNTAKPLKVIKSYQKLKKKLSKLTKNLQISYPS